MCPGWGASFENSLSRSIRLQRNHLKGLPPRTEVRAAYEGHAEKILAALGKQMIVEVRNAA
jgi:hypothetical protein